MRTVWAVTSGSYSDYRVEFLCANKELADKLAELVGKRRGGAGVEEFRLVESADDVKPRYNYSVSIDINGFELGRSMTFDDLFSDDEDDEVRTWDRLKSRYGEPNVTGYSYRSFDVALKAARDKLAEIKAAEAGL